VGAAHQGQELPQADLPQRQQQGIMHVTIKSQKVEGHGGGGDGSLMGSQGAEPLPLPPNPKSAKSVAHQGQELPQADLPQRQQQGMTPSVAEL
jgi:hypothetical protein